MSALLQPGEDVAALLFHAMLDIDFFAAVAREGDIHAAERSILQPVLPLRLVEKIGTEIAFAEEQPGLTRCSSNLPLLQKCAIGRDPGTGADHDDRCIIDRQTDRKSKRQNSSH